MTLATLVEEVLGEDLPVGVTAYDGSTAGPPNPLATLVIRTPDALRRIVTSPGELGMSRAYVAGDLDVEGDIFALLDLRERMPSFRLSASVMRGIVKELGGLKGVRPVPPPLEEVRLHGRRHSLARDRAAVSYHYDVSNAFYEMVLGPSLTYSCAVFETPRSTLEQAQAAKHELVCRKLHLSPGDRLLDVGCGWGSLVMHAAEHHGVHAVGVTISQRQYEMAKKRVSDAGLSDRVEIRLQDYREVDDGPYDAVSSIGMFEHVGEARIAEYFGRLRQLVRPGGRFLNHGISRSPGGRARLAPRSFVNRYVFPDGELHEVGRVVSYIQEAGFEVRHVESLREHYAMTLRQWVANLESRWDDAVAEVGVGRARVWRLYMAGSAVNFTAGRNQIYQVLSVVPDGNGDGGTDLRESYF
ncbi:MAG TPA: class I SAM-dependent methyltransferase [Acidimicrobiales bacterium]|nr:class I SAM-dependent methyltransferase [Acidimicrobiales bacterium]